MTQPAPTADTIILITGAITAHQDTQDALLEECLAHVRRSRLEPGCILHTVSRSVEDPLQFVFLEYWQDSEALRRHFAQDGSQTFIAAVRRLAAKSDGMSIYEARPMQIGI